MGYTKKFVKVVVLGDIGRSPRMQYHCMSLAEMGHQVDVIGYGATKPIESIRTNPHVFYHYMCPVPQIPIKLLNYVFKTILQSINLLFLLFITSKSDILIMQNPPAIPCMVICWIYTTIMRAKFIIDWHNYAHTIMALSVGKAHPMVKITKKIEITFGQRSAYNFCVTKAMKEDLQKKYGIIGITLYDRPLSIFRSISLEEKHEFLSHAKTYHNIFSGEKENETALTELVSGKVSLKLSRPGLLVSSTSWTEDEDFSVLLTALQDYEDQFQNGNFRKLPKLICAITGKGPLKEYYNQELLKRNWKHVTVVTPWLEAEDYPLLLASADLGVSLHTSSSGLDLPMKVVDMFGCGLPVCAFNFPCLNELVKHEVNSFVFSSPEELSKQILNWFEDFPKSDQQKQIESKFKTELKAFQDIRWDNNWKAVAGPIFE